jgi:hypothetical protein
MVQPLLGSKATVPTAAATAATATKLVASWRHTVAVCRHHFRRLLPTKTPEVWAHAAAVAASLGTSDSVGTVRKRKARPWWSTRPLHSRPPVHKRFTTAKYSRRSVSISAVYQQKPAATISPLVLSTRVRIQTRSLALLGPAASTRGELPPPVALAHAWVRNGAVPMNPPTTIHHWSIQRLVKDFCHFDHGDGAKSETRRISLCIHTSPTSEAPSRPSVDIDPSVQHILLVLPFATQLEQVELWMQWLHQLFGTSSRPPVTLVLLLGPHQNAHALVQRGADIDRLCTAAGIAQWRTVDDPRHSQSTTRVDDLFQSLLMERFPHPE